MGRFVHLHMHSEFSLLDGANRIKDMPKIAKELGMDAMAITDHGVMFGCIDFYKACKEEGVKPIIGCEVYVAPNSRFDKDPINDSKYNHLILLCKDNTGYQNLSKLVSLGFTEGYYYKPRIDKELLEKYHEGLICSSACLAGEIATHIQNHDIDKAKEAALWYKGIFGDDYYLEIQNNGIAEQVLVNQKIIELAKELDIPLLATNDSHYSRKEDAATHEVLLCIQTGKKLSDEDRMKFDTDELYIKSPEEMIEYFKAVPSAIENTVRVAEKCNVEFEFGHTILPNYDVPKEYKTHFDYLKDLTFKGLKERYVEVSKEIEDRTNYELEVINKMGYVDYFLIVWDYVHYAKTHDIPVGPGRGSGAGSIVAYAIGITDIDPIKYGLIFERFLNPERISMPDFDIDFCYEKRDKVIEYVEEKYGKDHVAQIITFGTMAAKMVIRDVGRVLDVPYAECDRLAKMIPFAPHITIKSAMEMNPELKKAYEEEIETRKLLDIAMKLEGMPRQTSTHACGIIIAKDPVDTYVPLYARDDGIVTQYIMTTLEELGLLKMDFLGLRTLTVIKDTEDLVKKNYGVTVEYDKEMNDPKVYKLWQNGESVGIFQFESAGMTSFMRELKPDCLEDIIAGVSLYRPGPMDQIPRYIRGKRNPGHNEYTHPALEPILNVTYGCMVYQEQVMQIVRDLGGYSLGRADLVRRAMGKKKLDVMAKERDNFVEGCKKNNIDEKSANKIFDEMSEFAKYAFNKSHAACYAVVAYRTAWLKTYYPAEFLASMLNSFLGDLGKVSYYIDECKRLKIEIKGPNINESVTKFSVQNGTISVGLGTIKNVGTAVIDKIVSEREAHGKYKSFVDFCERIQGLDVNRKAIECLIKAGAFDEMGYTRQTLFCSYDDILNTIEAETKKEITGQFNMFDIGTESQSEEDREKMKYHFNILPEFSDMEKLLMEKEMLGIYVSGHPLDQYKDKIEQIATFDTREENLTDGRNVKVVGIITNIKKKFTKKNTIMAFVQIEDLHGTIEVVVFDRTYMQAQYVLEENNIVVIDGKLSLKDEEGSASIIANTITDINDVKEEEKQVIKIDITDFDEEKKGKLRALIRASANPESKTELYVINNGQESKCPNINYNEEFKKFM